MTTLPQDAPTAAERVGRCRWYHTIDLAPGLTTPGWFDTRPTAQRVPMPASLEGKRCLDVGTWDGFWAFEMERRGAASVTAIDLADPGDWDWPPILQMHHAHAGPEVLGEFKNGDAGFHLAHEILGSKVDRRDMSVYDLTEDALGGPFDFVFLGSLLLHLRDPVAALAALRTVVGGEAVIADNIDLIPSLWRPRTPMARLEGVERPWWWQPNRAGLLQMVRSAGFEILEATGIYPLPMGPGHPKVSLSAVPRKLLSTRGREELIGDAWGLPHVAVRVRPASV